MNTPAPTTDNMAKIDAIIRGIVGTDLDPATEKRLHLFGVIIGTGGSIMLPALSGKVNVPELQEGISELLDAGLATVNGIVKIERALGVLPELQRDFLDPTSKEKV